VGSDSPLDGSETASSAAVYDASGSDLRNTTVSCTLGTVTASVRL
jgi:hypothetical protein